MRRDAYLLTEEPLGVLEIQTCVTPYLHRRVRAMRALRPWWARLWREVCFVKM